MKNYTFILEDKKGNVLDEIAITAENLKVANNQKKALIANTRLNDLHKVIIKN